MGSPKINLTDNSARKIKSEIGGLKTTMDKNNKDMTNQIEGLKDTIKTNAEEFRKEIVRIDKRLDENDAKTTNLINDAIAEAIRLNNAKRDEERETRLRALDANSNKSEVETLANRVKELEEEGRKREAAPTDRNPEVQIPREVEEAVEAGPSSVGVVVDSTVIPTMTFSRATSGLRGAGRNNATIMNAKTDASMKMPEMIKETIKPERFINEEHEISWELDDCKKKIIIRVSREDFVSEIKNYDPKVNDDFVFKNPVTYGARVSGVKNKIYNATGIMPHLLDIVRVSTSTVNAKLAWVTFASARTVSDIFKLAVQNGNQTGFHAFPHVPSKAMARKAGLEEILMRLQKINKQIRYQIQLGKNDLELFMKNHEDHTTKPSRKVEISVIDPNEEVPKWDLTVSSSKNVSNVSNPFDITKNPGKRGAVESPEARVSKSSNIDDWQICEFGWAFLEGTKTVPNYKNLTWENKPQQIEEDGETAAAETPGPSGVSETVEDEFDED